MAAKLDEMPASGPESKDRIPMAKWGAACVACATAKAKCIRSNPKPGSKCDRCARLVKDCSEQVHRPRKKRQVKTSSRTKHIEQRLNGLVNYLRATGGLSDDELAADTACIPAESELRCSQQNPPPESCAAAFPPTLNPWAIPAKYNSYTPLCCICRPESGEAPPPPDSDAALLHLYRSEMQRHHPFVIVPPDTSAAKLRADRPFLMSSIRMVASYRSPRSMRSQMYHLMKHISDHLLIRSQKSLDLLLGIIVIVGWYHYHCLRHAQLNNLIALAVTLVGELWLNRNPERRDRANLEVLRRGKVGAHTNEERRALAGVWFLSSTMSTTFWETDTMRYTDYLDECLAKLESLQEYESDIWLVHVVRLQHLVDRIAQVHGRTVQSGDATILPTAPSAAYITSFQEKLNQTRDKLPLSLRNDIIFQIYLNSAVLRLYEPPAVDAVLLDSISQSLTTRSLDGISPLDRLYQSCAALNTWFEAWLSVPVSTYCHHTSHIATQLVYSITMLNRWAKLTTPRAMFECDTRIPQTRNPGNACAGAANIDTPSAAGTHDGGIKTALSGPEGKASANQHPVAKDELQKAMRVALDPSIPTAIAALRYQLETQPGLQLNIPQILAAISSGFEEAHAGLQAASAEPATSHTIFQLSAKKLRTNRVRLQLWADFISTKMATLRLGQTPTSLTANSSGESGLHSSPGDVGTPGMVHDPMSTQSIYEPTSWTSDLFQNLDPDMWLGENMEWDLDMMNFAADPNVSHGTNQSWF